MNQILLTILAALAVVGSMFVGIAGLGLCMAGAANSSPQQLHVIKMIMLGIAVGTALCSTVSIVLMVKHHPGVAAIVGAAPGVIMLVALIWSVAKPS